MNPSDNKKLEEIGGRWRGPLTVDQAPNTATLDIVWLTRRVAEQDREIKELQLGKEAAERLNRVNVIVADRETDHAGKAEAERDGYRNQIKAVDNIIETYGVDGPLPHDRLFKLINRFEARIKELEEGLARAGTILEALNVSVKWELADEIKKEIQSVLPEIHRLLAEKEQG